MPTVTADYHSPTEVRALRIADNRLAELWDWNEAALRIEFAELMELSLEGVLDFDLDIIGFDMPQIDILLAGEGDPAPEAAETVEAPDPRKRPVSRPGDV